MSSTFTKRTDIDWFGNSRGLQMSSSQPDPTMLHGLTTAHLADACIRVGVQVRCGPVGLRPMAAGMRCSGRVLAACHAGSVDVFLEALMQCERGDVLIVDNGGRLDEACVGDLVALEAHIGGLAGIVIDGLHRDTAEIKAIGIPLFSLGTLPAGPLRNDLTRTEKLRRVSVGRWSVDRADMVVADDDGVIFLPCSQLDDIIAAASNIRDIETRQAVSMRNGASLREQTQFELYLATRQSKPGYGFREHLRAIGRAIEE